MTCSVTEGNGSVSLVLADHERRYTATIGVNGGSKVDVNGEAHDLPGVSLGTGGEVDLVFVNVDDAVELRVDGDVVFRHEYETDGSSGIDTSGVEIHVRDAIVRLTDVGVDRDVFYCAPLPYFLTKIRIPPDRFVMLGDNSSNSKDSRLWKEFVFLRKDGSWFRAEDERLDERTRLMEKNRRVKDGRVHFVDVEGVPRAIPLEDLASPLPPSEPFGNARLIRMADGAVHVALYDSIRSARGELRFRDAEGRERAVPIEDLVVPDSAFLGNSPFVKREQILGEAFFVFWPAWPPGRFRLRFL